MTTLIPPGPGAIARAVPRIDGWRCAVDARTTPATTFKEWMHFCVALPRETPGHLLINVNVTECRSPAGHQRQCRLIAMAIRDHWRGSIETFSPNTAPVRPGAIDIDLGDSSVRWRDGAFELEVRCEALSARLRLSPVSLPTVATRVSLGGGQGIEWVVLPRLEVTGWIDFGDQRITLRRALGYHDHNWGHFRWGNDLAWEWGFVNPVDPDDPWTAVFVRISDGARIRTLSQAALLWHEGSLVTTFQDRQIRMDLGGIHGGQRPFTLPAAASLLMPGASSGVPAHFSLEAHSQSDDLFVQFASLSKARVAIPSDADPFRLVVLNETFGHARAHGKTSAGSFDISGLTMMEFVRG